MATAVFWDLENCAVPRGVSASVAGRKVKEYARSFGQVESCRAYGDLSRVAAGTREELQLVGVSLQDVPGHRKEAADKAMLVDMLCFALDRRSPATLVLVTGDRDFSVAASRLTDRGYRVVLVYPQQPSAILRSLADATMAWAELLGPPQPEAASEEPPSREARTSSESSRESEADEVAGELSWSPAHEHIVELLRAAPHGLPASRLMRDSELGRAVTAKKMAGGRVAPADVLERLPLVNLAVVDGRKIFFAADGATDAEAAQLVDALHRWIVSTRPALSVPASRLVLPASHDPATFVARHGGNRLLVAGPDVVAALPEPELDRLRDALLRYQLRAGAGLPLDRLDHFLADKFPPDAVLRAVLDLPAVLDSRFLVHRDALHTDNFDQQHEALDAALRAVAAHLAAAKRDALPWPDLKRCLKASKGLASRTLLRRLSPAGLPGLVEALLKRGSLAVRRTPGRGQEFVLNFRAL